MFTLVRTVPVIKFLRAMYPGKWTYNRRANHWIHESGWYVYACAELAPRHEGDDDAFRTTYRRSDTNELAF